MLFSRAKTTLIDADKALPGRSQAIPVRGTHAVNGNPTAAPFPEGMQTAVFGLGCFWGAERIFWQTPGVYTTAVGYAGGHTPNPSYEEVCSARTGHTEAVLVVFDPDVISYEQLLAVFWEGHDPTQGMRQGNDIGTQYRSAIYTTDPSQVEVVERTRAAYGERLRAAGYGEISTEIAPAGEFFYA
ncbi:MAG: peptide-methionine (S)-S-oxide reductase MsrA, partial [Geodermatophilaceae bacterium]|nr:peptide-methionine (S)-S-oxide reductase MsrA [Geodermatophilaceae bacterium]